MEAASPGSRRAACQSRRASSAVSPAQRTSTHAGERSPARPRASAASARSASPAGNATLDHSSGTSEGVARIRRSIRLPSNPARTASHRHPRAASVCPLRTIIAMPTAASAALQTTAARGRRNRPCHKSAAPA